MSAPDYAPKCQPKIPLAFTGASTDALILEQHSLTEESFRALPKEMRGEIEKEIQEAIKRQYGLDKQQGAATSEAETPVTVPPGTDVPALAAVQAE